MSFYSLSGLINFITSLSMTLLVINKRPDLKKYIFLNLSVAFWSFFYAIWLLSNEFAYANILVRFVFTGMVLVPISFLHFCYEISKKEENRILIAINWFFACFFVAVNFVSDLVIKEISPILDFMFWPRAGILLPLYLLYFSFNVFLGHSILAKNYSFNKKLKWIFIATSIGFSGAATNFFLFYSIKIPPYGNILTS
ncbi:MAG: hypothetical protein GY730_09825, partial [bacterium]|nr:hypothetical protein [bacterium]